MLDIKQSALPIRFNFIFIRFANNNESGWRLLENRCIDKNAIFFILPSDIKLNSMLVGKITFFTLYLHHF